MPATYPLRLVGRKEERRILFHEYYDPAGISVCEWPSHLLLLTPPSYSDALSVLPSPRRKRHGRCETRVRFVSFLGLPFLLTRDRESLVGIARARPHITNTTISFSLMFSFSLPPVVDTATSFARVPRTRLIFYGCQARSLPP